MTTASLVDAKLQQAATLKAALLDFVLEAEGELAIALESYAAAQSRAAHTDINQRNLLIDTFLTEGRIGDQSPLDLFLAQEPGLSERDRTLLQGWQRNFTGLFAVEQVSPEGCELMNWLSAKHYRVLGDSDSSLAAIAKLQPGEILLARLAPVGDGDWMFFSPWTQMGKLGKPKLAVAIGNFKQNYKSSLYSDAPELLEQSWQSVEQYHQDFVEFFGSDEVTLPGYQFSKKLAEFQEQMTQKRLADAGIDSTKSLAEAAAEAGLDESEMTAMAETLGADQQTVSKLMQSKATAKMVMPQIELPPELKKAEQITALAHPRWGQIFLPNYTQMVALLESPDWTTVKGGDRLIRQYLEEPSINRFVWHRLAARYPQALETILRETLERPNFAIATDLDPLLQSYGKALTPDLPEIASVPVHLHNLFQEAFAQVSKTKAKSTKTKETKGFSRS